MNFLKLIFSVLVVIFLLVSVAIFIAGSLIFLNIQLYNQLYELGGLWIAFFIIVVEILIFSYVAIGLIERMFHNIFDKNKKSSHANENNVDKKVLIGVIIYHLFKLYINKSSRR